MLRWSIATVCMGGASWKPNSRRRPRPAFARSRYSENDLTFFSGKPRDARNMAADLGLEIVALQPMRDFEAMPDAIRTRNFERAERKFELMHELGARLLCLCSNVSDEAIDDDARASADVAELADRARRHGFAIGYEALAWGRHVKDWTKAWDIVRTADRPNLGIVLDSFHACARGNPLAPLSRNPGRKDRAGAGRRRARLADGPALAEPPLPLLSRTGRLSRRRISRRDRQDRLSRPGLARNLQRPVPRRFGAQIALDGMRSLRALGETVNAARAARAEPPLPDLTPPPPAPNVEGVEFIEFATGDSDAAALVALIEGLGFERAGRHRSKDVELFRQGEINIVVNQDREGFAHAFHSLHGASVCALALRVDSVAKALDRARAMGRPITWAASVRARR